MVGQMKFYIHTFKPKARDNPGNRHRRPAGIPARAAGNLYLTAVFLRIPRRATTRG